MKRSKEIFYCLLIVTNAIALFLIGISFLSGPSGIRHPGWIYAISPFGRHLLLVLLVSLISAAITGLLFYIHRNYFIVNKMSLIKIAALQFGFLIGTFIMVYSYIYLRYA